MNDLRRGRGIFGFKSGDIFIGRFIKDKAQGQGKILYFQKLISRLLSLLQQLLFPGLLPVEPQTRAWRTSVSSPPFMFLVLIYLDKMGM